MFSVPRARMISAPRYHLVGPCVILMQVLSTGPAGANEGDVQAALIHCGGEYLTGLAVDRAAMAISADSNDTDILASVLDGLIGGFSVPKGKRLEAGLHAGAKSFLLRKLRNWIEREYPHFKGTVQLAQMIQCVASELDEVTSPPVPETSCSATTFPLSQVQHQPPTGVPSVDRRQSSTRRRPKEPHADEPHEKTGDTVRPAAATAAHPSLVPVTPEVKEQDPRLGDEKVTLRSLSVGSDGTNLRLISHDDQLSEDLRNAVNNASNVFFPSEEDPANMAYIQLTIDYKSKTFTYKSDALLYTNRPNSWYWTTFTRQ